MDESEVVRKRLRSTVVEYWTSTIDPATGKVSDLGREEGAVPRATT